MVSSLNLVPYVDDQELAMGLLLASPRTAASAGPVRHLYHPRHYQFTLADVDRLLAAKRSDLAELVLASTSDVDLLEQVAYRKINGSLARAVCQNLRVPIIVLLHLYQDTRKNVSGAARRELASYLGVTAARSDATIARFQRVMTCPQDVLYDELARLALNQPYKTWTAIMAAVPQRAQRLPEPVVQLLVSELFVLGSASVARVLPVLVEHQYVTVDLLKKLLVEQTHGRTNFAVLRMLVPHLDDLSEEEQELLWSELSRVGVHPGTRAVMPKVSPEVANDLFSRGGGYRVLAALSGKVSDAAIESWARQWADAAISDAAEPSSVSCLSLLSHGAVPAEVVQTVLDRKTERFPAAAVAAASNPNLTRQQQYQLLNGDPRSVASPAVLKLAQSAHVHPDVVRELIERATVQPDASVGPPTRHITEQQRAQVLVNVLANEAVSPSLVASLPAYAVTRKVWDKPASRDRGLAHFLGNEFGSDLDAWLEFLAFLPEWEGTLGDLVNAVKTL